MIKHSSRIAYAESSEAHRLIRQRIRDYVQQHGPATRRAIASALDLETSCVAGRVNELMRAGVLVEFGLAPCPRTGRRVHWLRIAPEAA